MNPGRERNGRFGLGNCANPSGRPRKDRSITNTILKELNAPLTITENQKRKRVSKIAASAKQIANSGASGDLRAAKMVMDYGLKAEGSQAGAPQAAPLTINDKEIVARFIARLRATEEQTDADA